MTYRSGLPRSNRFWTGQIQLVDLICKLESKTRCLQTSPIPVGRNLALKLLAIYLGCTFTQWILSQYSFRFGLWPPEACGRRIKQIRINSPPLTAANPRGYLLPEPGAQDFSKGELTTCCRVVLNRDEDRPASDLWPIALPYIWNACGLCVSSILCVLL